MKKKLIWTLLLFFALAVALSACVTTPVTATDKNFIEPKISLAMFEVPWFDGYAYYAKAVAPTKGTPDDRGTFMPLSFVFKIENPNPYPIQLNEIRYTVLLDKEFPVMTASELISNWIPAGMTNEVRVVTLFTVRSALTGLLLASAPALKAKGWDSWETLERWWKGLSEQDGSVPITLTECAFSFTANGVSKTYPFSVEVEQ